MKVIAALCLALLLPSAVARGADMPALKLPQGFHIEVFADGLDDARSLRLGDQGTLFIGTRRAGVVYALRDGKRYVIARGLNMPNGLAFRDGALYVAEVDRILRYDGIERALDKPPVPQVVRADLPKATHHGWRYIGFGPDGKLYVAIGAPCNVCIGERYKDIEYASITRMNPDGSQWQTVARGVRNSVGFDWHPLSGELWFTENGRDWMGDDMPACELNRLQKSGQHFGFPYCHQGDALDPEFGKGRRCADYVAPAAKLGAHTAPLGMRFYTGKMFPAKYRNQILVAKHGSWNRSRKSGYAVNLLRFDAAGKVIGEESLIDGWLTRGIFGQESVSGRPVDLLVMPDGALLVSDDDTGRIYRVSFKP